MADMNLEQARQNMINQQIRTWEVLDQRVLDTLLRVPREEFVPPEYRNLAFTDTEIPLGHGQLMMAPKIEARMLQALNVQPFDTVLEVGTGSGYVTAVLASLGRHVFSVEIVPELKEAAEQRLKSQGIVNVSLDTGDAADGWAQRGTFDVIAVTGSLPIYNEKFQEQLNVGGRLFVVVGEPPVMDALLVTRVDKEQFRRESLFDTSIAPLLNARRPQQFVL